MSLVGKEFQAFINDSGTWKPYICATSISVSATTESIETSVSGNGLWASFLPTKNSWTATASGNVSLNDPPNLTLGDLQAKQFDQVIFQIQFQASDTDGNIYTMYGNCFITGSSASGSYNGIATFDITLQGTGPLSQSYDNPS